MSTQTQTTDSGPVRESARITSLDLIRGVAVLGILLMNAVAFKFGPGPYFNLSAGGSETWLDWTVGIFGEVFVDQKFMGLFSLLFGAGMILFIDRAASRGRRAVRLNLWRNVLLLIIGILHTIIWYGDVLMAYAIASFFLVAMRKLPNWALISVGAIVFALSIGCSLLAQNMANTTDVSLSGLWTPGDVPTQETIVVPFLLGYFLRALGLILIGAGPVSHRLHERRNAREDVSADGYRRTRHWPATCRRRSRHHSHERLLARDRLHRARSPTRSARFRHRWHT